MNDPSRVYRISSVVFIGLIALIFQYSSRDSSDIFDGFFMILIGIVAVVVFLIVLVKDIKFNALTKSIYSFIPTMTAFLFIPIIYGFNYFYEKENNVPLLIQAGTGRGIGTAWFEFKTNGNFKFTNSGGIGATVYRGSYEIKDSIILIKSPQTEYEIKTDRLVIQDFNERQNPDSIKEVIHTIGKQGNLVDRIWIFYVHEDNRKTKN